MESPLLLVVLDLNGTLMDSSYHALRGPRRPDCRARYKHVYFRPGMREFLDFLVAEPRIRVAIWTSCSADNARAVSDRVFRDVPEFCYSREECDELPGFRTIKDLQRVWDRFPEWNEGNTVMVDDSEDKLRRQPGNLLLVPEYKVRDDDDDDDALEGVKEKLRLLLLDSVIEA